MNDGILDLPGVSSTNLVVYDIFCWLSECESSGSVAVNEASERSERVRERAGGRPIQ